MFLNTEILFEFGANAIVLEKQVSFCLLLQTSVTKKMKQAVLDYCP